MADNPERQAWLDSLKAGDEVAFRVRYGTRWNTSNVEKRTKTGRIIVGGFTYRPDGYLWGQCGPSRIEPVTQEIRDEVRKNSLVPSLHACPWGALSLAALEQVYSIMRADLSPWVATSKSTSKSRGA